MRRQMDAHRRRSQRGFIPLIAIIIIAILAATAVGGVAAYVVVVRGEVHPPEQTAKYLPSNTQIYFSLNLRPGNDQLRKFRDILERFREHPNFQPKIDEALEDAETETGIDPEEDVLPWLGPEVAVGVVKVVESATAIGAGGTPPVIVFFGTKDPDRSEIVLREWIEYLEGQEGLSFQEGVYKDFPTFTEGAAFQHYVLLDDYVLFATDRGLLENTIDRIDAGSSASSLYENERFQEARKAGPSPRFSMLYVDTESILTDVRRTFGAELPSELRDRISDFVSQWATLTSSFIDNGMKFTVSSPISEEVNQGGPKDLSLSAAQLLPKDTLALLAFAVDPSLDGVREQLRDQRIEDLGPEFYDGLFQLGLGISPDDSLADVLDAVLKALKDAFGVDLERDILDWMSGELAFALLPINFRALSANPQTEAVDVAAFIQFDIAKRDAVIDGLEHLLDSVQEGLGFAPDAVSYGGGEGAVFDLSESIGISPYRPGYLILDDQLLIATTEGTLELAASLSEDQGNSLAEETEYARLVREIPGDKNPLLYVNIREIVERVVAALDSDDQREYAKEVEPFVGPLKALLLAGVSEFEEGLSRFSLILTIE